MSKTKCRIRNDEAPSSVPDQGISRRGFISKLGIATAGLVIGACSQAKSPLAPEMAGSAAQKTAPIPSPNLPQYPETLAKVAKAKIDCYERTMIRKQIEAMFDALGGINDLIKSGDKVGIKINLTGGINSFGRNPTPPFDLYLTHPEIVRAVGELAKDAGASEIYVVEAVYEWESFTYQDPLSGLSHEDVTNYLGGTLIDLNAKKPYGDYKVRPVGDGGLIYNQLTQNGILDDFDCFISLPKAKRHACAGVTHAMKNLVGTLPVPCGLYNAGATNRKAIHNHPNGNSDLCRVILDLNKATPIHLTVIDAIKTNVIGEGPWNTGRNQLAQVAFDTLLAAKGDMVAADAVATNVIGFNPMATDFSEPFPDSINYLKLASELGMGTYDLDQIEVIDATASTYVRPWP